MSSLFRSAAFVEVAGVPPDVLVYATAAAYATSQGTANLYHYQAAAYAFSHAQATATYAISVRGEAEGHSTAYATGGTNPFATAGTRATSVAMAIAQVNRPMPDVINDCVLFFPYNRWSDRSSGAIAASSEIGDFIAANTQTSQRSRVWRSNADTSAYLTRDFGNAFRINSTVLVSHNATNTGKFRVRIGNDPTFGTNLYDSGYVDTWEPSFATTGLMSEFAESDGRPTNATIELLRYCSENARTARYIFFPEVAARYVRIDFQDPDNTLGWNEIAYVYVGLMVLITPDQAYGWTLELTAVNRVQVSASGQYWIDDMHKKAVVTANFASRPSAQASAFWMWLNEKVGTTGEFIISLQPVNAPRRFWTTIYGRMTQLVELENIALQRFNAPFTMEELL
jgi:hypothetical protein